MHIGVLLAGVADYKRPLGKPTSGVWRDLLTHATTPFKLSPFDESALEVGLKLRDRHPNASLSVIVTDGSQDVALLRTVAAYRPSSLVGLLPNGTQRGDPAWLAHKVPEILKTQAHCMTDVNVWLIGREHGDLDDGVIPPYLAEAWRLNFVGLALQVQAKDLSLLECRRSGLVQEEAIVCPTPALISVSNDRSNRLRHPLMKNLVLAKQQLFTVVRDTEHSIAHADQGAVLVDAMPPDSSRSNKEACTLLTGTVQEQAFALARYLRSI
jgi:electron transfer flavoprotein beta subunit